MSHVQNPAQLYVLLVLRSLPCASLSWESLDLGQICYASPHPQTTIPPQRGAAGGPFDSAHPIPSPHPAHDRRMTMPHGVGGLGLQSFTNVYTYIYVCLYTCCNLVVYSLDHACVAGSLLSFYRITFEIHFFKRKGWLAKVAARKLQ